MTSKKATLTTTSRGAGRKPRSDSLAGKLQAVQNVGVSPIECPPHLSLREVDKPFWPGIIKARSREEWDDGQLVMAWELCRCMGNIKQLTREIDVADMETLRNKGYPSIRSAEQHKNALIVQQITLMRSLLMIGMELAQDQVPKRRAEREAEATLQRVRSAQGLPDDGSSDSDSLLAL